MMQAAWRIPAGVACALWLLTWPTGPARADAGRVRPQGLPVVTSPPMDADFGVSTRQPGLRRRVQMYQWQRDGSGYRAVWSERWIDPTDHDPEHSNPLPASIPGRTWLAERVTLDGDPLDARVIRRLGRWHRFRPGFSRLSQRQSATFQPEGDGLGSAENPMAPAIGDLRIHWDELRLPPLGDKLNLHDGRWVLVAGAKQPVDFRQYASGTDPATMPAEPAARWPRWGSWLLFAIAAWLLWRRWRA